MALMYACDLCGFSFASEAPIPQRDIEVEAAVICHESDPEHGLNVHKWQSGQSKAERRSVRSLWPRLRFPGWSA